LPASSDEPFSGWFRQAGNLEQVGGPRERTNRASRREHAEGRPRVRQRRVCGQGHERRGREGAPTTRRERTWRRESSGRDRVETSSKQRRHHNGSR